MKKKPKAKAKAKPRGKAKPPARVKARAKRSDWLVEVAPLPGTGDPDGAKLLAEARALGIKARAARSATVYELSGIDGRAAEDVQSFLRDWLCEMCTQGRSDLSVP